MKFKRRSGGNEIILPNGDAKQSSAVQESLAAGVARGHRWLQLLEEGKFASISELADAARLDRAYVFHLLKNALHTAQPVRYTQAC